MILAGGMASALAEAPRVALVRVQDIYQGLAVTAALEQEAKKAREQVQRDPRADQVRKMLAELQSLKARLADKNNPLDPKTSRKLTRGWVIKQQEADTYQQSFENFKAEQEKLISRKKVLGMRASLNKIMETAKRIAKDQGYDLVLDSSGSSNTGMPFVLYSRQAPDLTELVKAALNDTVPAATPNTQPKP